MADVGLHRTEPERPVLGAAPAVGGQQGLRLDRVTERGAGAVRLDRVHLVRRQPGGGQGVADQPPLGGAAGGGEAVAGPVLVDAGAADHGQHRVPEPLRVGEPLDHQHADALTEGGAVGGLGEGLDHAVLGQAALAAELGEDRRAAHQRDATGQRERGLAPAQRLDGQVQGDQGAGAGGVDGEGWALQAEGVGHPAAGDGERGAGQQVAVQALGALVRADAVLVRAGSQEDAGPGAPERGRVDARVLQRLPGGLQGDPLLRVHGERLARADAEEIGVELRRVVQESTLAGVAAARCVRVRVEEVAEVPATVVREVAGDGAALADDPPEVLGGGHLAGEADADADDRDRLVVRVRRQGGHPGVLRQSERLRPQELGEQRGGRVVEARRDRQGQVGGRVQPGVHLDQAQGVEALLLERAVGLDHGIGPGAHSPEHRPGLLTHQVEQHAPLLGNRQRLQSTDQLGPVHRRLPVTGNETPRLAHRDTLHFIRLRRQATHGQPQKRTLRKLEHAPKPLRPPRAPGRGLRVYKGRHIRGTKTLDSSSRQGTDSRDFDCRELCAAACGENS
ncbi:hypothetical protein KCMC57_up16690 [Kitasatospora sp. CMC57]